jgi:REP element-mobilizing transposase RayT
MARAKRLDIVGFYHVINRGVERRSIFLEPQDYEFFMTLLLKMTKDYDITLHTFCLMTNHYHLLVETKQQNLSKAIQFLNDKYAKYFNKKYSRVGHLWQGRFKSLYLYDDAHFWIVAKYIERNPITAQMVQDVTHYRYQSLFQWKYKQEYKELITDSKIFDMTLSEYESYISSELQEDALEIVYTTPKIIKKNGDIKLLYKRLETFFEQDRDINRDENIKKAFEYGYTKSEIANFLSLSHTAVSKKLL